MNTYRMAKSGKADINNRAFEWVEGDEISLSEFDCTVLKRGGYVGILVATEEEKAARADKVIKAANRKKAK